MKTKNSAPWGLIYLLTSCFSIKLQVYKNLFVELQKTFLMCWVLGQLRATLGHPRVATQKFVNFCQNKNMRKWVRWSVVEKFRPGGINTYFNPFYISKLKIWLFTSFWRKKFYCWYFFQANLLVRVDSVFYKRYYRTIDSHNIHGLHQ